jgi:hypothetical protein
LEKLQDFKEWGIKSVLVFSANLVYHSARNSSIFSFLILSHQTLGNLYNVIHWVFPMFQISLRHWQTKFFIKNFEKADVSKMFDFQKILSILMFPLICSLDWVSRTKWTTWVNRRFLSQPYGAFSGRPYGWGRVD